MVTLKKNVVEKKDIENIEDIKVVVDSFYNKVKVDDKIAVFFNDIAQVNWDIHLPKMYSFWSTILFGSMTYKGSPVAHHIPINSLKEMEREHFDRWLELWTETVNELFEGKIASAAIYKATNIAGIMSYKMEEATRYEQGFY